jgi:site-specific DNA-methyltransferase (adenine-specific)
MEKQKPVHEIGYGHIKAAIWRNQTEHGVRHNVTLTRLYRKDEQWKTSDSFGRDDLLVAAKRWATPTPGSASSRRLKSLPASAGESPPTSSFAQLSLETTMSTTPYLNAITHGDCTTLLRQLPDACTDLVLTDPPYLVRYRDRQGRTLLGDHNGRWVYPAFFELYRVLKPDSFCIAFYGWNKIDRFMAAWRECGFTPVGHFTWVKPYASSKGFTSMRHESAYLLAKGRPRKPHSPPPDVLPWEYSGNSLHPTQKPVSALCPLVEAYSQPGDIVLDPFAGSGSTGIAAVETGRQFMLFEKDERYFNAARERLRSQESSCGGAAPR